MIETLESTHLVQFYQAPLRTLSVPTDSGHRLLVEEWGNRDGIPLALLHGGPGSGSSEVLRRLIDPMKYRVISPDQRGAGRSTPRGDIRNNTTADLVADMEHIRNHLRIDSWLLVGGSWGAALALATALANPGAVTGLLLRATFLARRCDIEEFFSGAPRLLLDGWRLLPELAQSLAFEVVQSWYEWEHSKSGSSSESAPLQADALSAMYSRYRIQSHYLRNGCWLQEPPLLTRLKPLHSLPIKLLHGSEDRVCPVEGAIELAAQLPKSTLSVVTGAGHDPMHPAMVTAMQSALVSFL